MFAEELSGNAGRKRAEANRAKRRQMMKQKKTTTTTNTTNTNASIPLEGTTLTSSAPSSSEAALEIPAPISSSALESAQSSTATEAIMKTTTTTSGFSASSHNTKIAGSNRPMTALERAEEQRKLRASEARERKAAIQLQSYIRRFLSNLCSIQQNQKLLQHRLSDLQTLADIMKQKKGINYTPPPATTTALARVMLYLTYQTKDIQSNPNRCLRPKDLGQTQELLRQMIRLCFLPSLTSLRKENRADSSKNINNNDMNPFKAWMESFEGKRRFSFLLHFCVVTLFDSKSADASFSSCLEFLREICCGEEAERLNFAFSLLNPNTRSCDVILPPMLRKDHQPVANHHKQTRDQVQNPLHNFSIIGSTDFIAMVRYYLLYLVVPGSTPIPPQAEALRQGCISDLSKQRAGDLVRLCWNIQGDVSNDAYAARFFQNIFTVPLLVWKISSSTISFILTPSSRTGIPPFFSAILAFEKHLIENSETTALVESLPEEDVPLTKCPATNTQCLLANLVQFGRLSVHVNGSSMSSINFSWARWLVDLLALVLDSIPVRTFSNRESAVVWVSSGGGHSTPVVISVVVLDQCKTLFVDSYVRNLLSCAIDTQTLELEKVIQSKNEKDKEVEKDLAGEAGSSAISLAAKESRMDRNKSFWNSSKWAQRVSKGVAGFLSSQSNSSKNKPIKKGEKDSGALRNTTSQSRSLASGEGNAAPDKPLSIGGSREDYSPKLFISLCVMFSVILARWGGGGGRDEIAGKTGSFSTENQPKTKRADKERATSYPESFTLSLLNSLCFSTELVKAAWCLIQSHDPTTIAVQEIVDPGKGKTPVRQLTCLCRFNNIVHETGTVRIISPLSSTRGASVLYVFAAALSHTLIVTDDVEIHDFDRPLPIHQIRRVINVLKRLLHRACTVDIDPAVPASTSTYFGLALVSASSRCFRDLYDRSSRRPLCLPKAWLVSGLLEKDIKACNTHKDYVSLLNSAPVLRVCPMLVSFKRRLLLFDKIVRTNREELQGVNSPNPFNPNPLKTARVAVINRGRILEDGLATMNHLGSRMRERIAVHYINEAGVKETGIDAGGLFKEFWTDLCGIAFDPNYALFKVTEDAGNCMFPSPASAAAHGSDHVVLFEFLGRILGKALYEGITIQPRFAHFFLSFLRGDYNFLHMLPDLSTIDAQLYNNLMFLKTYDGDATDLCLTFTITKDDFGGTKEIPLIPNGADIEVTNANKQRYIGLVAKYYVVDQIKEQSEAFTRGLWDVVDPTWLRLFNEPELQILISGASEGKIDVEDLRRHTRYIGGFTAIDRHVARFWKVFASLNAKQQAELLRFVTSCERPPPLGFASLNPPFTIQRVGIMRDGDKLPASSTCFNTLKLPTYSSEKVLRDRILYAISSGAGFELT